MNTDEQTPETTIATMNPETELQEFDGQATYCPEDNKLRLYVGRVPRDEYLKLKAEGWTSTPKQTCDFVAMWTPQRRDTCLEYAGIIEDEDMSPQDRAADRAERFSGYLDKRLSEAVGHADRYDAGPRVHGFQNYGRAVRAADRHDKIAGRAVDAWSKAEYWQQRTAGVISHALYTCSPSVRMGRIKELELAIARHEKHERDDDWTMHYRLRLAYENQMLEACGGRAAVVEMEAGGFLGSHQITKVTKSPVTGNVVSVEIEHMADCNRWGREWPDGKPRLVRDLINIERMKASVYTPPTDEQRAAFAAKIKDAKKAKAAIAKEKAAKGENCPLINPTNEDAQRLQDILNKRALEDHCRRNSKSYGRDYADQFKPSTICKLKQETYSAVASGSYARAETRGLCKDGELENAPSNMWSQSATERAKRIGPAICKIRITSSNGSDYGAKRVIIITDKPQKPLPSAVWESVTHHEPATV